MNVDAKIFARILIYEGSHPDCVVYLRTGMNVDFAFKWRWFFEYLAARVKVANPRRKVELTIKVTDTIYGEEWKELRTKNLLKHRRARLSKLEKMHIADDLFGFRSEEHQKSIDKCREEIRQLECGEYPLPDFPGYVNKIKDWI